MSDLKILPPLEWPEGAVKEKPRPATRAPLDWMALAGRDPPLRRWAVQGWLGFGHITLLVGQGGIGKTLLSQQLASCLAIGKPFIGDIAEPLTVLMWACEDDHDELWRRQVQIANWCNAGLEAFAERLVIVPRHGLENALVTTEYGRLMYSPLIAELAEQARDLKADVVMLDNVAQLYGAGENDRHAVTAFLNVLSGHLAGLAVMLLAHPSRTAGSEFSGSSAWENTARTRLYLGATLPGEKPDENEPSDKVRFLARRKSNYSAKDWRRLVYANGALTADEPESASGLIANIRAGKAEKAISAAITKLTAMGVAASDGTRSQNFLPKLMSEYQLDEGLQKREIVNTLRTMMLDGKITRGQVGRRENRTKLFGLVLA